MAIQFKEFELNSQYLDVTDFFGGIYNVEDFELYWQPIYDNKQSKEFNNMIKNHITLGKLYKFEIDERDGEYCTRDDSGEFSSIFLAYKGNIFLKVSENKNDFLKELLQKAENNISSIKTELSERQDFLNSFLPNALDFKNYVQELINDSLKN